MSSKSEDSSVECKELTEEEKARASVADLAYCKACEEKGMKVCTWEEFDAWKNYVDGKIDETKLEQEARLEMDNYAASFGKYLVIQQEEPAVAKEADARKDRVKRANRIYKRVCEERDLNLCFFSNFAAWSEYVDGKMSDDDFYTKANIEVDKMKTGASG